MINPEMRKIGAQLRSARQIRGVSILELHRETRVPQRAIREHELGKRMMGLDRLEVCASFLGFPLWSMNGGQHTVQELAELIGRRLKAYRRKAELTQPILANSVGLRKIDIGRHESGSRLLRRIDLAACAKQIGARLDDLATTAEMMQVDR